MESVAERVTNHFILKHARVPRVGQSQYRVVTTGGFIDCLHKFSLLTFPAIEECPIYTGFHENQGVYVDDDIFWVIRRLCLTPHYYFSKKQHGNNQDFRAGVWRNRRG
jgi:hypothetical protein